MSPAPSSSYKELQKEAKRCGIPANMKRSFLESAIEAFVDNNREKLDSIVRYHKSQRKRRFITSTSNRLAKDFNFAVSGASETAEKVVVAGSPMRVSSSLSRERYYKLSGGDDDDDGDYSDSSNFHPDSTSTPNRSSPIVNLNHYPSNGSSPQCRASDVDFRSARHFLNYPKSRGCGSSTLLPRIRQENFHPFRMVCSNASCLETNANANHDTDTETIPLPVSATYECTRVADVEKPSYSYEYTACAIEKQRSSSSYRLRNVSYSNDFDTRKNTISPEAPRSSSSKVTFVDNFRPFSANSALRNDRSQLPDHFNGNIADATSLNAEFDSDSDTETLSLTDEMVNFFEAKADNKISSFTSSNAVSRFTTPNSNAVAGSCVAPDLALRPVPLPNEPAPTWNDYDDATNLTARPIASSHIALDGYTLLPSISTLLPEYKIQAYCQGYSESCQQACEFAPSCCNAHSQTDWSGATPMPTFQETESGFNPFYFNRSALRQSTAAALAAAVPTSSSPSNGVSESYAQFYSNEAAAAESWSSASAIEELPADLSITSPFDVFNEAMEEMQKFSTSTNAVESSNRLVLKTTRRQSASCCETLLEQRTASLVLKHETISIRDSATADGETTEDIRCNSLEIKVNEGVAKGTVASTVCQNVTRAPTGSSLADCESPAAAAAARYAYRSCRNEAYGCNVITDNEESARTHEKECLHQVVHCPSDECNWYGVVRTLTDHVYVCHKSDLNVGNDLVYVINRNETNAPFVTYFQLHQGIIFVISLHVTETKCIATMQYLPEIETADYKNKRVKGTMQLVYFTGRVETKTKYWRGIVRPYFEDDKTLYQTGTGNVLQSEIGNSKNVIVRILVD